MRLTGRALLGLHRVEVVSDLHAGQHGRLDAVVEPGDVLLDVLVRPHVLAQAEILPHELVEEAGVQVVAHAEAEDPRVDLVPLLRVGHDPHFVRLAHGGQAVGEEDDIAGPAGVVELAQRDPQGLVDVRAAAGIQPFGKAQGLAAGLVVVALQLRAERFDLAVEGDDVEQVALAEIVQARASRPRGPARSSARSCCPNGPSPAAPSSSAARCWP